MKSRSIGPFDAVAAGLALRAKDLVHLAGRTARVVRSATFPDEAARARLPGPARRLLGDIDAIGTGSGRAARGVFAALPFAPRPLPAPASLAAMDACRAREGRLGRVAIAASAHEAIGRLLARFGEGEAVLLETLLADAVTAGLDAAPGGWPARRAAAIAVAIARSGAAPSAARRPVRLSAVAYGLATLVASGPAGPANGDTLDAAADLVDALSEEALAALSDTPALAAFLDRYAAHV